MGFSKFAVTLASYNMNICNIWSDNNSLIPQQLLSGKVLSRNNLKPAVSEETRLIVGRNLTEETDFYLWCRQRLNTMYYALVREGRLYLEDSVR